MEADGHRERDLPAMGTPEARMPLHHPRGHERGGGSDQGRRSRPAQRPRAARRLPGHGWSDPSAARRGAHHVALHRADSFARGIRAAAPLALRQRHDHPGDEQQRPCVHHARAGAEFADLAAEGIQPAHRQGDGNARMAHDGHRGLWRRARDDSGSSRQGAARAAASLLVPADDSRAECLRAHRRQDAGTRGRAR